MDWLNFRKITISFDFSKDEIVLIDPCNARPPPKSNSKFVTWDILAGQELLGNLCDLSKLSDFFLYH